MSGCTYNTQNLTSVLPKKIYALWRESPLYELIFPSIPGIVNSVDAMNLHRECSQDFQLCWCKELTQGVFTVGTNDCNVISCVLEKDQIPSKGLQFVENTHHFGGPSANRHHQTRNPCMLQKGGHIIYWFKNNYVENYNTEKKFTNWT